MIPSTLENIFSALTGNNVTILLGAGTSVSAGIPCAKEIAEEVKNKYSFKYNFKSENYYDVMGELDVSERRDLFIGYDKRSRVNISSMVVAKLLERNLVKSILTTNFDTLIPRASSIGLNNIPIYDATFVTIQGNIKTYQPSIIYLHGQAHGFWQLNTIDDHNQYSETINILLDDSLGDNILIIVGYSGYDPLFKTIKNKINTNKTYWVCYKDFLPNEYVMSELTKVNLVLENLTSDEFFYKLSNKFDLNKEINNLFLSNILTRLSAINSKLDNNIDIMSKAKINISLAKDFLEDNAILNPLATVKEVRDGFAIVASVIKFNAQFKKFFSECGEKLQDNDLFSHFELLRDIGRSFSSLDLLHKACEWVEMIWRNENDFVSKWGFSAGLIHSETGRKARSIELLNKSIKYYDLFINISTDKEKTVKAKSSKALTYQDISIMTIDSNKDDALLLMEGAMILYQELYVDLKIYPKHLNNYSSCLIEYGSMTGESSYINKAIQLAKEAEDIQIGSGAYNLACCYSIKNERELAFFWLDSAINTRNHKLEQIQQDSQLNNIKKLRKFNEIINKYFP